MSFANLASKTYVWLGSTCAKQASTDDTHAAITEAPAATSACPSCTLDTPTATLAMQKITAAEQSVIARWLKASATKHFTTGCRQFGCFPLAQRIHEHSAAACKPQHHLCQTYFAFLGCTRATLRLATNHLNYPVYSVGSSLYFRTSG